MHIIFAMFTVLSLLQPFKGDAAPLAISVQAESAILINGETGAVLYEKNPHTLQYPASITKIATAALALKLYKDNLENRVIAENDAVVCISEEERRSSKYTVPAYWLVPGGSHIGIKKGEELSLRDLLYGMMVASGNDAANVIAHHVGDNIPNFMASLNLYLKEMGCQNTVFYNPHGLHHPNHQTTAYDMARITQVTLQNPTFRQIVSTVRYTRPKTNKQPSATLVQTNRLLKTGKYFYPKAIGVKTGYTSNAQHTLVAAAEHDNRLLIAVLLKCKERENIFKDAIKMFETAFNQPKVQRILMKAGPQKFSIELPGAKNLLTTYLAEDLALSYYPAEEPKMKCLLYWNSIVLPVKKDQVVGEIRLLSEDDQTIKSIPLYASEDVSARWWWSLRERLNIFKESSSVWKGLVFVAVLSTLGLIFWRMR